MFNRFLHIFICILLYNNIVFTQNIISSLNIADLNGAIEIERNGKYDIELPGYAGEVKEFKNLPIGDKFKEKNSIFLIKHCLSKDEMTFDISFNKPFLQLAIYKFRYQQDKSKLDISEMELVYLSTDPHSNYSNYEESDYKLPEFECVKGDAFLIVINSIKRSYGRVSVNFKNNITDLNQIIESRTKIFDDRLPDDPSALVLRMVDEETEIPVLCNVNYISKKKNALYIASEIIFGQDSRGKVQIQCDAEGYFFVDTLLRLNGNGQDTITLHMKSVSVGKVFKIDKIEFIRGTANIVADAEKVLRRIKDFLVLNSEINIEIQGHVNNEGKKDDEKSMKLSKLRAKTIRKYFVASGVNKDRITIKGYGNTKPIYPSPKTEYEQQANRRVEIEIIK